MEPAQRFESHASPTQADVVAFLRNPSVHGGASPRHIETHLSHLIIAGQRAYKMKKAQRWSMVDYSTLAAREHFCRRELAVNAVAKPLYLGLQRVTLDDGKLALGGTGDTVEWLVEMRRFEDRAQLDMMVDDGAMTGDLVDATADAIAKMHRGAPVVRRRDEPGAMHALAEQLGRDVPAQSVTDAATAAEARRWQAKIQGEITRLSALIDRRARHGFVRRCHGDLHLSNICLFEGKPVPFDAIEFSEEIATIDVLYDLAFVLIDLEHRGHADFSARLLSRYLEWTRDYSGLALLPAFASTRAMVRALTRGARGLDPAPFVAAAMDVLERSGDVWLAAVGGLSGSGKSTVSRELSARSGAVVVRSDTARKHLFGKDPLERLPPSAYRPQVSERVHRRMMTNARRAIRAGWPVILDATFIDGRARHACAALAATADVPFLGAWLDVPLEVMMERVRKRRGDASDADEAVLQAQSMRAIADTGWTTFDGTLPPDECARAIAAGLPGRAPGREPLAGDALGRD